MQRITEVSDVNLIRIVLMIAGAAVAVASDLRVRRIPNTLTAPLLVTGLGIGLASSGIRGLLIALFGCLSGALFFLVPVAKLGWGMGDLKLVAALSALGGPLFALWLGLYALAAGGAFALLWLKQHGELARVTGGIGRDLRAGQAPLARSGFAIPYAAPIAAGMLAALFISPGLPL